MGPVHQPAMLREVVEYLDPRAGSTILDLTVGMGGHTRALIERGAFVIGLDRDPESLEVARQHLAGVAGSCTLLQGRMSQVTELLAAHGVTRVDGCLIDAGISMDQMLDPARAFSAHSDAELDMRFDRSQPGSLTAFAIVNEYLDRDLLQVFHSVGNGREARRVAARIVSARQHGPIRTTAQLAALIAATICRGRRVREIDAAPYLLAIRAAVNDELTELEAGLQSGCRLLSPTGTLVALTWHSAEHRVAKQTLRRLAKPCDCPPALPCVCGRQPLIRLLTPKALFPSAEEVAVNRAARSVRLSAAERLDAA